MINGKPGAKSLNKTKADESVNQKLFSDAVFFDGDNIITIFAYVRSKNPARHLDFLRLTKTGKLYNPRQSPNFSEVRRFQFFWNVRNFFPNLSHTLKLKDTVKNVNT